MLEKKGVHKSEALVTDVALIFTYQAESSLRGGVFFFGTTVSRGRWGRLVDLVFTLQPLQAV